MAILHIKNSSTDCVVASPMKNAPVAALAIADLHLCHTRPSCRCDSDWYGVMAEYLKQVKDFHREVSRSSSVEIPILCAGDVFDRWNSPPELINFAINNLPYCYSVAGNHDCPNHRREDIKKSAYWTLVETGVLVDLKYGLPKSVGNVRLHGFPWGTEIVPWEDRHNLALEIAVVHKYVWVRGKGYPGAPKEARATRLQDQLQGYDIATTGDNHTPFDLQHPDLCTLMNCGSFLRRKRDEIPHKPSVVVIYQDGRCDRHYLDVSNDQFNEVEEAIVSGGREKEFVATLSDLGSTQIDFAEVIKRCAEGCRKEVATVLRELLEETK